MFDTFLNTSLYMTQIIHKLNSSILFHIITLLIDLEHIPTTKYSWSKETFTEIKPMRSGVTLKVTQANGKLVFTLKRHMKK